MSASNEFSSNAGIALVKGTLIGNRKPDENLRNNSVEKHREEQRDISLCFQNIF